MFTGILRFAKKSDILKKLNTIKLKNCAPKQAAYYGALNKGCLMACQFDDVASMKASQPKAASR